jgi:hypothetical protein
LVKIYPSGLYYWAKMITRKGNDFYIWQNKKLPTNSKNYARLSAVLFAVFVATNLALAIPRLINTPDLRQSDNKQEEGIGGSRGDRRTASIDQDAALRATIPIQNLGILVSHSYISVSVRPGETKKVMAIVSNGATGVSILGRPTNSPGISWTPNAATFRGKTPVVISIRVASDVPEGTYEGKALVVSHPSENAQSIADVTVVVSKNAPPANSVSASGAGGSQVSGSTRTVEQGPNGVTYDSSIFDSNPNTSGGSSGGSGGSGSGGTGGLPSIPPPPSGGGGGLIPSLTDLPDLPDSGDLGDVTDPILDQVNQVQTPSLPQAQNLSVPEVPSTPTTPSL